jgi:hypothetical protein
MDSFKRILLVTFIILAHPLQLTAQKINLGFDVAAVKPIGEAFENQPLKWGIALDGTYFLNEYLSAGARYSFSNLASIQGVLQQVTADTVITVNAKRSVWSMEIAPILRLHTNFTNSIVNLFTQIGTGMYIIHDKFTTTPFASSSVTETTNSVTNVYFGFSISGGVTLGEAKPVMVRLYPVWTFMWRDETPDQYWTFNTGIVFGFGK